MGGFSLHLFHCGAGSGRFNVGHDSAFRLCSSLCHPDATCDLRHGTSVEARNEVIPRVRDLRSRDPELLEKCRRRGIVNLRLS